MSNFTLNTVFKKIKADILDVLNRIDKDAINELTPSDVCDLLDEKNCLPPEVANCSEAWAIIESPSFINYVPTDKNSLGSVSLEAQRLVNNAYYSERASFAYDILEALQA